MCNHFENILLAIHCGQGAPLWVCEWGKHNQLNLLVWEDEVFTNILSAGASEAGAKRARHGHFWLGISQEAAWTFLVALEGYLEGFWDRVCVGGAE